MSLTTAIENNRYPGGKGRAYQHIINLMPPHRRYVETHFGGGAVFRHKRPAEQSICIDADARVVAAWRRRRPELEIIHGDAASIIPTLGLTNGDLVYADPPYLLSTRRGGRCYRHEMREKDHEILLDALCALPCAVVISGYRSSLYDTRLGRWRRTDYVAVTHRGTVSESAWTNFEPGEQLHDYDYIGRDFRDRESMRRRRRALLKRMTTSDPRILNAALCELARINPTALVFATQRIK